MNRISFFLHFRVIVGTTTQRNEIDFQIIYDSDRLWTILTSNHQNMSIIVSND